jgi:hypothetical protein
MGQSRYPGGFAVGSMCLKHIVARRRFGGCRVLPRMTLSGAMPGTKDSPMTANEQLLKDAIRNKSCVRGMYDGHERFFCPHVLGGKDGKVNVLIYQYAGRTSKGPIVTPPIPTDGPSSNWKCMLVSGLTELSLVEGTWYTCQKHTQSQTCVDQVVAEVSR